MNNLQTKVQAQERIPPEARLLCAKETPVSEPNENETDRGHLDPEQAQSALQQSIERVNSALATLDEAQKTREEIFELVVSV